MMRLAGCWRSPVKIRASPYPAKLTGIATGLKAWPRKLRPLRCSLDFARNDVYESTRNAERSKPDEQFRVHRRAHVHHRRFGCDQPARRRGTRILPPQREPARRSPHRFNPRDTAAAQFAMVGHVQME